MVGRRAGRSRRPEGCACRPGTRVGHARELHRQRRRRDGRRRSGISSSGASATCSRGSASRCARKSCIWASKATIRGTDMATLRIEGGRRLSGRVAVEGNKNSALPLLAACLLTDQECVLTNVPRIRDVEVLVDLLPGLGATVDGRGTSTLRVRCDDGHERSSRSGAGRQAARFGAAARPAARAQGLGAPRAARRRFPGAADDLDAPTGAGGDGRRAARRAGPRARRAIGAQRRVVLSRRGVGHRHRDGAARGRRREGTHRNPPRGDGAARRRAVPVPARDGRVDRGRRHVDDSRRSARRDSGARRTGSTATTSRPGAGASSPRSRAATSR